MTKITESDYKEMENHFGVTNNYDVAGYLLIDGKMLDFSGKHWGDDYSTSRQVDHRDINEVIDDGDKNYGAMINMIGNGNIRLIPETAGINLAKSPNSAQTQTLRGYINHFDGEIIVDIDEVGGDTIHSFEYGKKTSASKIISDIKDYFDNGTIPQKQSSIRDYVQFDIKRDGNGKEYYSIETNKDIFNGIKNIHEIEKAAFNFILGLRNKNIVYHTIDGKNISFIRLSAEEFTNSEESKKMKKESKDIFKQKMRMIPSLREILLNSKTNWDSPDFKNHLLINSFSNYRGRVRVDNVIFNTIVRVGKTKSQEIFYDINLEVDTILPQRKSPSEITVSTSTNSISQSAEKSTGFEKNTQFDKTSADKYEAKQRYADRIMRQNAEVETLTSEQHSALAKIAELRHKFHSGTDSLWNPEGAEYSTLWGYISDGDGGGLINKLLSEAGLPTIDFPDITYIPSTADYYEFGGKDEYETYDDWLENSGDYVKFVEETEKINNLIEDYLRKIDKEHGTKYAPTGFARLQFDRTSVDNYTEKQYNDYGWVRANEVLSTEKRMDFLTLSFLLMMVILVRISIDLIGKD